MVNVTHRGVTGDEKLSKPEAIPVFVFMGVDPASSLSVRSDFSVIFIVGVDSEKNIYCLDYFRKRVKPMDLANAIIDKFEQWRPERTRIESVGYQEMIRDYLRTEYKAYNLCLLETRCFLKKICMSFGMNCYYFLELRTTIPLMGFIMLSLNRMGLQMAHRMWKYKTWKMS